MTGACGQQAPVTTIRQMQHESEIVDAVLHYNLLLYPKPNRRTRHTH
jgi:hypothetical protein